MGPAAGRPETGRSRPITRFAADGPHPGARAPTLPQVWGRAGRGLPPPPLQFAPAPPVNRRSPHRSESAVRATRAAPGSPSARRLARPVPRAHPHRPRSRVAAPHRRSRPRMARWDADAGCTVPRPGAAAAPPRAVDPPVSSRVEAVAPPERGSRVGHPSEDCLGCSPSVPSPAPLPCPPRSSRRGCILPDWTHPRQRGDAAANHAGLARWGGTGEHSGQQAMRPGQGEGRAG